MYWKYCLNVIAKLPSFIKVRYKGAINGGKIPELLKTYHFLLMPSEGENFGHPIIESLSAGTPFIISENTPWKLLKVKKIGCDVSLNKPINLYHAIEEALKMEQESYDLWSSNAFGFSNESHQNKEMFEQNINLFK